MTYHLCWIVICCPISCYCSNIISKSMELICAHTEQCAYTGCMAAALLLCRCLWDFRCHCCRSPLQWPCWPAFLSTMASGGTSFQCWDCWWFLFTCCFLMVSGALFFGKSMHFKCTTRLFDPVVHLFSHALVVFLSIWRVDDIWSQSFSHACQVHNINKKSIMILLWGSGSRCSKMGREH